MLSLREFVRLGRTFCVPCSNINGAVFFSKQFGDIDKTKLKTAEALKEPGSKEGEVKMIRNEDQVEVYQWSVSEGRWQKVGEVVDAIGQDRKQMYEGREYDYVFDVQLSETGPALKLPFNVSGWSQRRHSSLRVLSDSSCGRNRQSLASGTRLYLETRALAVFLGPGILRTLINCGTCLADTTPVSADRKLYYQQRRGSAARCGPSCCSG